MIDDLQNLLYTNARNSYLKRQFIKANKKAMSLLHKDKDAYDKALLVANYYKDVLVAFNIPFPPVPKPKPPKQKVGVFDVDGNMVNSFSSIYEASRVMNCSYRTLLKVLDGSYKYRYKGFVWKKLD